MRISDATGGGHDLARPLRLGIEAMQKPPALRAHGGLKMYPTSVSSAFSASLRSRQVRTACKGRCRPSAASRRGRP